MWSCPCAPSPNTSGNVRKVTHIGQSPTPRATEQEADITRHALEAACWLHLGCWSNNFAHSHVSLGAFNHEYCSPVRCRSAHIRLIEPIINDALRIVMTGCLRPTPANNLPTLAGHGRRKGGKGHPRILKLSVKKVVFSISRGTKQISPLLAPPGKTFGKIPYWPPPGKNPSDAHVAGIQPAQLRRSGGIISLTRRAMESRHLLHSALTRPLSPVARRFNRDTHLYPQHNNSSTSLTIITYVRRSGRIINGMRSGRTTPQDSAL